jgi:tricorn protease
VNKVEVTLPEEALPRAEDRTKWRGALDDAWRIYAEHAFRPGAKWLTVKPRYEELIGWATDATDASYVIREMLGEAGQSHITFGFSGNGNRGPDVGLLGADFDVKDGFYHIAKIYRGDESDGKKRGPLAAAGVNAGDYLVAVNGQPLSTGREIYAAFEGLAGKETRLTVNSVPSAAGAREVVITPIGNERALRLTEWMRSNRARVAEATGGRIGYMYIADVDEDGVAAFRGAWQNERDHSEAVIVDVRNCNGGIHPEEILDALAAKPTLRMYDWRGKVPPFGLFLDGPKVMIANDQSVSGCDELPLFFKQAKVGPLVGTRTFGAILGAGAMYETAGGGRMTVPEFGFFWSEMGWLPENYGVDPDYTVNLKPDGLTGGRDLQLEKAIEVAMTALKTYKKAAAPPQYRPELGVGRP